MWYYKISSDDTGKRTAERLLDLKNHLAGPEGVPIRRPDTLLLATWNIRDFDSAAYGTRGLEPLYYIAEIISHFDLVAVQEVREDLAALDKIQDLLGSKWRYLATDVTEGRPGNRERLVFLYDSKKVRFGQIAGEVVIPPIETTDETGEEKIYLPSKQLYRTPFICSFRAGWTKFIMCVVHIQYGENVADDPDREEEIRMVANFLAKRAEERAAWSNNMILIGDFNIFSSSDITMQAITDAGFIVPPELQELPPTNTGKKARFYDQIAFMPQEENLESTGRAGVYNYYNVVYREEDEQIYIPDMGDSYFTTSSGTPRTDSHKPIYYRTYWRTHQMSDHLPMWVELKIDFSREYLIQKAQGN